MRKALLPGAAVIVTNTGTSTYNTAHHQRQRLL